MAKMKWDINGKGKGAATGGGNNYDGPNLPKGSWTAKIKRMEVTKIQSAGANKGKPRIRILLEVTGMTGDKAKYNGHPIWDGLNIIESGVSFVNGFLHALTDGSERQNKAIESAFWDDDKGPDFKRIDGKSGEKETHIIKIGRVAINSPNGETLVQVTTKPDQYNGDFKAAVTGYIPIASNATAASGDLDDADDDDTDDGLGDVDDDDDDDYGDEDTDDEEDYDDEEDDGDEEDDDDDEEPSDRRSKPF